MFIRDTFTILYQKYPICLVDVGASGGVQKKWKQALPFLKVYGFDPCDEAVRKTKNTTMLPTGLYKEKGAVDLYITSKKRCSSLLKPNEAIVNRYCRPDRFRVTSVEKIDVDTLDHQLAGQNETDVDFIKLDTQGSELAILEGAQKTLASVFGIEIEAAFNAFYREQPLLGDIDVFMKRNGFELFDLRRGYWKVDNRISSSGQLISGDALYFRTHKSFSAHVNSLSGDVQKSKVLKALAISCLFKKNDYSFSLFQEYRRLFNENEIDAIQQWFRNKTFLKSHHVWLQRLHSFVSRIEARLRVWAYGERDVLSDKELGNN